eukprot:CAMPEP_0194418490 /NCGR_PEP_ID=MMETSP0176-20130528/17623_1 /TAXON_ID=216777 /ORGANISM="Proboscia alata, Strain PI-D3" /LENGTH=1564 /DNA_ID=CAMNT_0039224989 /DNA_START=235 /DNA_END=4929 /DNA_ORIENTATION=-
MADVSMMDQESDFEIYAQSEEESDFDFSPVKKAPAKKAAKKVAAPKAVKKKAAPKKATKKPKKAPLGDASNRVNIDDPADDASDAKKDNDFDVTSVDGKSLDSAGTKSDKPKKTIEQVYQKKTQLEHILLRPDTYIGSVERVNTNMWVLDSESNEIVDRNITYTPGLFKIFDEIVVNASDNKQRDHGMDKLEITIDGPSNTISVKNTGKTIPVVMHKEHNCYVPTLIFGHLLTGSNFDDDEKKTTGGRNGYGAKLANIFSTEFVVECSDVAGTKKKFKQVFTNNMQNSEKPKISSITKASEIKAGDWTKVTFKPDLKRFKMDAMDDDTVALLSKRAYDIAGSMADMAQGKRLNVYLNGKKINVKSFKDYVDLYRGISAPAAFEKVGTRWEIGVGTSEGSFQQVSFVNSICTSKGGQHVSYVAEKVAARLAVTLKKKNKGGAEIKGNQIKNHLCVFVNCLIENPAFDSQTKDFLTTRSNAFGSKCDPSEVFLKKVDKSNIVDNILAFARFKAGEALKKKGGTKKKKLHGIAKLDDANHAGTAKSKDCTLIITEGDSAKTLAMSGLSVVGRDLYGCFPLKGKPLNVREANHTQIMKNEEIKNIIDILGLKFGVPYDEENIKTLRYGHLMIMADQDHDGSHIKGLVINFIHHFWPGLLDVPGFLVQFITPIVKASRGKHSKTFFTLPEYNEWVESTGNKAKGWSAKYYKGLGTSTAAEAKDYFSNLDVHEVQFLGLAKDVHEAPVIDIDNEGDDVNMDFNDEPRPDPVPSNPISGSDLIDMAFSKARVSDRKAWLNALKDNTFLNYAAAQETGVNFSEFINKELILFSKADNQRSIPHIFDGFKPSQRKVLFACFKRKLYKNEIKVAQLAGYVSEHSAYHHGEASLNGTIVNMAQSFLGSNNLNFLTPSGQFGTRRMGGKDAASPRYIFTKLEKITRTIFHPDDDALLNFLDDDGLSIEPSYYVPVIPTLLVNGSDGIGTGWSTSVPNYCTRQIISNIRKLLDGEEPEPMDPHYYGFKGGMIADPLKKGSFVVTGTIERVDESTLHISELPIKKWTQDYKVFLESMLVSTDKSEPQLKDLTENHTDGTVSFTIKAAEEKINAFEKFKGGLMGKFKLSTTLSTNNMNVFDHEGKITKYESPEAIMEAFFKVRLSYYGKRKALLLKNMRRDQLMLSNKARFVLAVCTRELIVSNRPRKELLRELKNDGYDLFDNSKPESDADDSDTSDDEDDNASDADLARGYEYLLGMKIWSLTLEKVEKLRKELDEKTKAIEELEGIAPSDIWKRDLDAIEHVLGERDGEMDEAMEDEKKSQNKSKKARAAKAKKIVKATAKKKEGKKVTDWDSELEDSDEDNDFMAVKSSATVKPKPKRKPTLKKGTVKKSPEPEEILSLADSMKHLSPFKPAKSSKANLLTCKEDMSKTTEIDTINVDDIGDDEMSTKVDPLIVDKVESSNIELQSKKRPSPKAGNGAKQALKKVKAAAKKVATKKTAPKKKASPKIVDSESEDSFDEGLYDTESENDDVEVVAPPPRARSARSARAKAAPVSYVIDDSSSESEIESDDEEFDED